MWKEMIVQDTSHSLRPTLLSGCAFLIPTPGLLCLRPRVWTPPAPACLPPHSVCQDPWIPHPFMLGLWANTFPLEVHFSAGRHHPRPWVPGLPILLLTCLMSSIPTDVPCFSGPLGACIHLARGAGAQGAAPPSPCPPSEAPHTLAAQKPPVTGSFPRGKGEFTLFR